MGWTCISETCAGHIIDGKWDGVGIAYYSLAEDMARLFNATITWFFSIAGWVYFIAITLFVFSLITAFFLAVRKRINALEGNK
jgi:hypothetical protein